MAEKKNTPTTLEKFGSSTGQPAETTSNLKASIGVASTAAGFKFPDQSTEYLNQTVLNSSIRMHDRERTDFKAKIWFVKRKKRIRERNSSWKFTD